MNINPNKIHDIAIIGGGAAGQMAALRSVLNHTSTLWFLGDANTNRKGRAQWVSSVDNIPGFFETKRPITATTKDTIAFIESRSDLSPHLTSLKKAVQSVRKTNDIFEVQSGDDVFHAKFIILCTGTMDVQPVIQGSIKPILPFANRGDVDYCMRCDGHKTFGRDTAVIGHTTSAAWVAIILKERYDPPSVRILTHGQKPAFDDETKKLIEVYNITVHEDEIIDILANEDKSLAGFVLRNETIRTQKAFPMLGSIVYNELAKQLGAELDTRDHLIVNNKFETSVPGLYATGDIVSGKKKQVYTAWDMSVDAVDDIDLKLRRQKREVLLNDANERTTV